jgi:CubicO group peptidase (beta-lactamase class C family)
MPRQDGFALVISLAGALWLAGLLAGCAESEPSSADEAPALLTEAFPGETWERRSPSALGMDSDGIERFKRMLGRTSFGCIVKDGYLVDTWGWEWRRHLFPAAYRGWASATKPVLATLVLFAIQEGLLPGTDFLVRDAEWPLREEDRDMTLRHLLDNVDGYGLPEGPGEGYAYNDYGTKLLMLTVLERIYGVAADDLAAVEDLLFHPDRLGALQLEDGGAFRLRHGAPRLNMSTCDAARFGLLLLRGGRWHDRQILSEEILRAQLRAGVPDPLPRTRGREIDDYLGVGTMGGGHDETRMGPGVFGVQWWFNAGGRLWPDLPHDAFQANGHWNRFALTVIPSLGLVVAWRDGNGVVGDADAFHEPMNDALRTLQDAIAPR